MSLRLKYAFPLLAALLLLSNCREQETFTEIEKEKTENELLDFRIVADDKEYRPVDNEGNDLSIFVPVGTKLTEIVARFNEETYYVTVNDALQESGVTANNFSDFKKGVVYKVENSEGSVRRITVKVLDSKLPVVSVRTAESYKIIDRVNWREATISIFGADGKLQLSSPTGIRGRGNWTWEKYPKKPYALKLGAKAKVLGMPAHKRWALLALYQGFIGNDLMFEATRRAPAIPWAPRGQFVELVLNGKYQGLYYLCEQIKIDEDRMPICQLKKTDIEYPDVSGGYLIEYDELYDEEYKFYSEGFGLPVQLKSPSDSVPDEQFNYIRNFINEMEAEILKIGSSEESHYQDYLDIDSFADYWMVLETVGNYEAYKPRSVKMYKGRDGVDSPKGTVCRMKAGPLWDQEWFLVNKKFNSKDMYYYKYLFKDPEFVQTVKTRWAAYKDNILGNDKYISYIDYLNKMVELIQVSAQRDINLWDNPNFTLSGEVGRVRQGFVSKIYWMDEQINNL